MLDGGLKEKKEASELSIFLKKMFTESSFGRFLFLFFSTVSSPGMQVKSEPTHVGRLKALRSLAMPGEGCPGSITIASSEARATILFKKKMRREKEINVCSNKEKRTSTHLMISFSFFSFLLRKE